MATLSTACPLDCPDGCTLAIEVEDGRVLSIDGTRKNSLTAGFICSKVRHYGDRLNSEQRLLTPAIRVGKKGAAEFKPVSWDEALTRITSEFERIRTSSGGEAILPLSYGGSNGKLTEGGFDRRFFHRLGASQLARTVCAAATGAALRSLYGGMPGLALEDYKHAKLIVIWGTNPSATGIHFVPIVQRAQAAGAKLVVIDPRRTPLAKRADLHLALRPGTDLPLALALIQWMCANDFADRKFLAEHTTGFDELENRAALWTTQSAAETCELARSDIETFARLFAETRPTALRCGWGPERNRNGGSAIAAIMALPAVAGHFGVPGGGLTMSTTGGWGLDLERAARVPATGTRAINMNHVGRALVPGNLKTGIEAVFIYDHNPIATLPNQNLVRYGLEREDLFTVVFDQVMTDSARYADVLLPATTFLEHEDLGYGYGSYAMYRVSPVVSPAGETRSNADVFCELEQRMGLAEAGDPVTPSELADLLLEPTSYAEQLKENEIALPEFGAHPVQFVDTLPGTDDQKIHLFPSELDRQAAEGLYTYHRDPATAEFPLTLISPSLAGTISSTFGERIRKLIPLEMHAGDAAKRNLSDGQIVRVWNEFGEVICPLSISDVLIPGTVVLPKGMWSHTSLNGNTANALAPDTLSDVGRNACFNDARVEIAASDQGPTFE